MIRPLRLSVLLLVSLAAPLLAAPLRFLPWDDEVAERKLGVQTGKTVTTLADIHPYKRSRPIQVASSKESQPLLVALDRKDAEGKPPSVVIKVADGMESPLVLILADPSNPAGLRTFVVEDNPAKFPWGTVRFINATAKPLLVRQEKSITSLPVGWTPVDVSAGGATRNVGVQLVARDNTKDILYSGVWEYDPEVRKLAFVVPGTNEQAGALDLKIIPEDRRVAAAAAAPVKD